MTYDTEVLQLVIAVVMAPIIIFSLQRIEMPSKPYFTVALLALTFAYVFTVVEGFAAPELFNTLEHAMLALSGVMFAMSAWVGVEYWHRRGGGAR